LELWKILGFKHHVRFLKRCHGHLLLVVLWEIQKLARSKDINVEGFENASMRRTINMFKDGGTGKMLNLVTGLVPICGKYGLGWAFMSASTRIGWLKVICVVKF
jgi:hypothetical protein